MAAEIRKISIEAGLIKQTIDIARRRGGIFQQEGAEYLRNLVVGTVDYLLRESDVEARPEIEHLNVRQKLALAAQRFNKLTPEAVRIARLSEEEKREKAAQALQRRQNLEGHHVHDVMGDVIEQATNMNSKKVEMGGARRSPEVAIEPVDLAIAILLVCPLWPIC